MGLSLKLKREQKYAMSKNFKTLAVECLKNGNYHVYRKFLMQKNIFKMDPKVRKLQEPGNKQNKNQENKRNCQIMYNSNQ